MPRTLLLDGDIWVYRACLMTEQETEWTDDLWTLHGDLKEAMSMFDSLVTRLKTELESDRVVIALSDKANFRKAIYPEYKSNRKNKRKPVCYRPLREYLHEKYEVFQRPALEGDDVIGILMTSKQVIPGEKICVSVDKDMQTIPGKHLNYDHAQKEKYGPNAVPLLDSVKTVTVEQADQFHLVQSIAGDTSDGYPGCTGIGVVRADRWLSEGRVLVPREHTFSKGPRAGEKEVRWEAGEPGTPWEVVVSVYRSAGLSEEYALAQAQVARILRNTDYNFETKRPIPWQPISD